MHINMHMKREDWVVANEEIVNYVFETCEQHEDAG